MNYRKLKEKVLTIKLKNPELKRSEIFNMVSKEFPETNAKQISNILQHNKTINNPKLPPIPVLESEEIVIPIILEATLHDTFLTSDQKIEILKIIFPEDE